MSSINDRIKQIVAEQLGVDEDQVTNEASFMDDLGADSLDVVELVMALEEEFGLEISDEDAEKLTSRAALATDEAAESVKRRLQTVLETAREESAAIEREIDEALDAIRATARERGFTTRDLHVATTGFDWVSLHDSGANLSLFAAWLRLVNGAIFAVVLFHLPLRYQDRTRVTPIAAAREGADRVIEGEVLHNHEV